MTKARDIALLAAGAAMSAPRVQRIYEHKVVREERAPTDESVRLLKAMEEKAREKVLATIPLKTNEFEGNVVVELDGMNMEYVLSAMANVNGKRVKAVVREYARGADSVRDALPKLRDALAKELATQILLEAFDKSALNLPRF